MEKKTKDDDDGPPAFTSPFYGKEPFSRKEKKGYCFLHIFMW